MFLNCLSNSKMVNIFQELHTEFGCVCVRYVDVLMLNFWRMFAQFAIRIVVFVVAVICFCSRKSSILPIQTRCSTALHSSKSGSSFLVVNFEKTHFYRWNLTSKYFSVLRIRCSKWPNFVCVNNEIEWNCAFDFWNFPN